MANRMGQPAVTDGEALNADLLFQTELEGLGQPATPGESLEADLLWQEGLGFVGTVAAIGLKAALPSIQKGINNSLSSQNAKASRANRNAALNQLAGLLVLSEKLVKGTNELVDILKRRERPEITQVQQADIAWQNAQKAWREHSANFASLAGQSLGQVPAAEEVKRLFLQGVGLITSPRVGQEGYPPRQRFLRRLMEKKLAGQVPASEEVKRLFLQAGELMEEEPELGGKRSRKRAARLGWLGTATAIFNKNQKQTDETLNTVANALGMTRVTSQQAATQAAAAPPPALPPAPAPILTPPLPARIPGLPKPPMKILGLQPAVAIGVPIGLSLLGALAFLLLKRNAGLSGLDGVCCN